MLAADTALEVSPSAAAGLDALFHELADALGVDGLERICVQKLVAEILAHEGADVVT